MDAKLFSRRGVEKDDRTRFIEDQKIAALKRNQDDKLAIIKDVVYTRLEKLLAGQECLNSLKKGKKVLIAKGRQDRYRDSGPDIPGAD